MPRLSEEELKQNKTLQQLDKKISQKDVEKLQETDMLGLMRMQDDLEQAAIRYDQQTEIAAYRLRGEVPPVQAPEQSTYAHELEMAEKQKKKKGAREKDATRRAAENGTVFETDQGAALQQAVQAHHAAVQALPPEPKEMDVRVLQGATKLVPAKVTGNEFTPDPATNTIDVAKLLQLRRSLQAEQVRLRDMKKKKQRCEDINQAVMETNGDILAVLDDAVRTYFAANGVDCDTGKTLGAKKVMEARRHLALAVENYQEAARKRDKNLCERYVPMLKRTHAKDYQEGIDQTRVLGNDDTIPADLKKQIKNVRGWIAANPEVYAAKKELVDKLYRELVVYSKKSGEIVRENHAVSSVNLAERRKNPSRALTLAMTAFGEQVSQKSQLLARRTEYLHSALKYLLKGTEPTEYQDLLFLEKHCAVVTPQLQRIREKESLMEKWPRKQFASGAQTAAADEMQVQYDRLRMQYIEEMAAAKKALKANPQDDLAQRKVEILDACYGSDDLCDMQRTLCMVQAGTLAMRMQCYRLLKDSDHISEPVIRGMTRVLLPIGQEGEMDADQLMREYDSACVIWSRNHLDRTKVQPQERGDAYDHEVTLLRDAAADMMECVQTHPEAFQNRQITLAEMLEQFPHVYQLTRKAEETFHHTKSLVRLAKGVRGEYPEQAKDIHVLERIVKGLEGGVPEQVWNIHLYMMHCYAYGQRFQRRLRQWQTMVETGHLEQQLEPLKLIEDLDFN